MASFTFHHVFHTEYSSINALNGPLFSKWLPNGKQDCISFNSDIINGKINLWFEQHGVTKDNKFIEYKYNCKDFDPANISKQGIIDAGLLHGELILKDKIPSSIDKKIKAKVKNDEELIKFIKPIVKEIVQIIHRFVNILRYKYGQYWLPEVQPWDSREDPLGVFCKYYLDLKYIPSCGKAYPVIPDSEPKTHSVTLKFSQDFSDYLSQADWNEIQKGFQESSIMADVNKLLIRAHEYYQNRQNNFAVIFSCTVLELAIDIFYKHSRLEKDYQSKFESFSNLKLPAKVLSVLLSRDAPQDAGIFIYFIKLRNEIVHDGKSAPDNFEFQFPDFLKKIPLYFLGLSIKLPYHNHGNSYG
jgi:hypothetical protein